MNILIQPRDPICVFLDNLEIARKELSKLIGFDILGIDIEDALMEVYRLDECGQLLSVPHKPNEIVDKLREYPFEIYQSEILCELDVDISIVPPDVPSSLIELTLRSEGEQWRIHKSDADPFPSNPHAVRLGDGMKLNLSTGELYRKTTRQKQPVSKKNLLKIRELAAAKKVALPPLNR